MKKGYITHIKNAAITVLVMAACFGIGVLLDRALEIREHITTVFVFGVFLVSLVTDGYAWGVVSAFCGMFAVNFAFTFPFFAFDFSVPENFLSALVMIIISLMTSSLTTRLKRWQTIKAQGEQEMMRANLLRAVSHDLRTPLTTIYGSSSAMLESYDSLDDGVKKKMIGGIMEDSEWLIRMVENLLSITRIDSGAVKLIKTPTSLYELIDAVIIKFNKRYPTRRVDIDIPEEPIIIPMDPMLIGQVLDNILENAVSHAEGMTRLGLRVFVSESKAVFEIADDGCGIERDRLEKIFTGYYDGREQSSDAGKRRAGIGLSVCATIIKAHGGAIRAENGKERGAIFRFTLPIDNEAYDEQ